MAGRRYKREVPEDFRWVTLQDLADELGLTKKVTLMYAERAMRLLPGRIPPKAKSTKKQLFPADLIEVIRGLRGEPHRVLAPVERDWLTRYLETGDPCQEQPANPPTAATPGPDDGTLR